MRFQPMKVTLTEDERRPFLFLLRKHGGPSLRVLFEIANGHPLTRDQLALCGIELHGLQDRLTTGVEPDLVDEGDLAALDDCLKDLNNALGQLDTLARVAFQFATLAERAITTRGEHG